MISRNFFARIVCSLIFVVASLIPTSAAEVGPISPQAPAYTMAEFAPYAGPGSITVHARLIVRDLYEGGTRAIEGKTDIYAAPNTPISTWYLARSGYCLRIQSNCPKPWATYPEELKRFTRYTTTDSQGYFTFENLPPGRYLFWAKFEISTYFPTTVNSTQNVSTMDGELITVHNSHVENGGSLILYNVLSQATVVPGHIDVPYFGILSSLSS